MITIKSYSDYMQAQIDKGLLEANGIKCMLSHESLITTLPIGEIELMVEPEDVGAAKELLK